MMTDQLTAVVQPSSPAPNLELENTMISDVMFEAVSEIDRYLTTPTFDGAYRGRLRAKIVKLRDEMEYIRLVLDSVPGVRLPPKPTVMRAIAVRRDDEYQQSRGQQELSCHNS
jgi:hypothetical protein